MPKIYVCSKKGKLTRPQGIPHVLVELISPMRIFTDYTDNEGVADFIEVRNWADGTYIVKIRAPKQEYRPYTRKIQLSKHSMLSAILELAVI